MTQIYDQDTLIVEITATRLGLPLNLTGATFEIWGGRLGAAVAGTATVINAAAGIFRATFAPLTFSPPSGLAQARVTISGETQTVWSDTISVLPGLSATGSTLISGAAPTRFLRDFLPLVVPHAMGVPDMIATFNLRLAAIEFCERTNCWRHIITQTLVANAPNMLIPAYSTIHKIENATFGTIDLTPIAYTDIGRMGVSAEGQPEYITQSIPNTLTVLPFQAGAVKASVFLKPIMGFGYGQGGAGPLDDYYDQVPEFLFLQYAETIAHGALSRLLIHDGTSYQNTQLAEYYRDCFDKRAVSGGMAALQGQQRAAARTTTQWF